MFNDIFVFEKKRTAKQAVGFYIIFLVIFLAVAMIVGGIVGMWVGDTEDAFSLGVHIGSTMGVIVISLLGIVVIQKKDMWNVQSVFLLLFAASLSFFTGALLGLIPVSYLTTRSGKQATPSAPASVDSKIQPAVSEQQTESTEQSSV